MSLRTKLLFVTAVAGVFAVPVATASAPPVGPLPRGPVAPVHVKAGKSFAVTLPRPTITGGSWRIARAFDSSVVRELKEATTRAGGVRITFRAVAPGKTTVVFALTRGERRHAYAARTFRVTVVKSEHR